jgi:tRNA U34 5-carboxymethylaminomethyl modifying GTPase MnmE/TrmE
MSMLPTKNELKTLYEVDEHLWLEKTIELLRANRLDELDVEKLIEELESLSRKDRNKAESLLEQVIRHLLLLQYWSEEYQDNAAHWEAEIDSFRTQLRRHLTTNLRQHLEQELKIIYTGRS